MQTYAANPSSFASLISASGSTVGTAAEDLTTFFDMSPFEAILVNVTCVGTVTATSVVVKFATSASSAGTSVVNAKDAAGADILATIAAPALGVSISMWVRTRGLLKFGSPLISTGGAACDVAVTILGISPHDTSEIAGAWRQVGSANNTAFNAGLAVANVAMG